MAVPNTNTFNMRDVSNTVDPSKSQLTQLITVANAQSTSLWDATYSGSKNSLLNFRNYGSATTMNAYTVAFGSTEAAACSGSSTRTVFQLSSSFNFTSTIYSSSAGLSPATSSWYKFGSDVRSWKASAQTWLGAAPSLCSGGAP
tara:strand:+ start:484 stop:915 length:432 start_codon:yes stop_codon:yes gene_type:complete